MQYKITSEVPEPKFAPIKLEIIIETPEELASFWHRLNSNGLPPDYIGREVCRIGLITNPCSYRIYSLPGELWSEVNRLCVERGVK